MTRPINQLAVSRAVVHTELRRRGGRQDKRRVMGEGEEGGARRAGKRGGEGPAWTRSRLNVTDSSSDIPTRIPCGKYGPMLTGILITCMHTDIRVHPRGLVRPPPPPVARAGVSYQFEAGQSAPIYKQYPSPGQYNPSLFPALPYQH